MVKNPLAGNFTGRSAAAKMGSPTYDNIRENIDPHIKTTAINTKEIKLTNLSGSNISITNSASLPFGTKIGLPTYNLEISGGAISGVSGGFLIGNAADGNKYLFTRNELYVSRNSGNPAISLCNDSFANYGSLTYNTATDELSYGTSNLSGTFNLRSGISTGTAVMPYTQLSRGEVTSDFSTESGAYVCNVVYGAGATPPTASNYTRGTIYFQYTP